MKLGELFIQLTTKGDTKKLDQTISKMEKVKKQEKDQVQRWKNMIRSVTAFATGISAAVVAMDRLGNSVLKTNQLYTNFNRQTGMSISNLNKMAGLAKLSGMNLPVEQVAGDLNRLQQKIFRLGLTGEGSAIFAQLGMNPLGMKSDQFIDALRQRLKGLSEVQKSYVLDELGLSREWLNVLELSDDEYSSLLEQSRSLQLSEYERKQLAKYTLIQQKNNMRWELAKQKLAIARLPIVTKIMEKASEIAVAISKGLGNEKFVHVVRDIALWMGIAAVKAGMLQRALSLLVGTKLMQGLGFIFGAGAAKTTTKAATTGIGAAIGTKTATKAATGLGLKSLGKSLGGFLGGPAIGIAMLVWTLFDIFGLLKQWFDKDTNSDENEPPIDTTAAMNYRYMNSNMVNNFYNNPVPQQVIADDLTNFEMRYLKETKR